MSCGALSSLGSSRRWKQSQKGLNWKNHRKCGELLCVRSRLWAAPLSKCCPILNILTHMKADGFIRPGINLRFTVVDDATKIVPAVIAEVSKRVPARDEAILTKF